MTPVVTHLRRVSWHVKRNGNASGPEMRKKIPVVIKCISKNNRAFVIGSLTGDRGGIGRRSHHFT